MLDFVLRFWPILLFVGASVATSAVALYQVRVHENKIMKFEKAMSDLDKSATKFDYHLQDRRKNPVRTIDGCLGERDACPIKTELEKDRLVKSIESNAVTDSLMRMEVLAKERHKEILDEFNLHRKTHTEIDRRHNDLSEKVAVLNEIVNAERKHNERKGDKRE